MARKCRASRSSSSLETCTMRRILPCLTLLIWALAPVFVCADDPPKPTAPEEPSGMVKLFNGRDLTGWDGDTRLWRFYDGVVRGETSPEREAKGNTFLIWKGGKLADFELRLSFRIDHGNSGIQYRSQQVETKEGETNKWVVSGYQAEVENTPGKAGFLYHERGRGELCYVGDKVEIGEDGKPKVVGKLGEKDAIGATYKKSDWNDYVIIAKGNHLVHYLNGIQTIDVVDNDPKGRALEGILALQIHAGPPMVVEFRNVRLKQYERTAEKKE
jgi:hypothetical protein